MTYAALGRPVDQLHAAFRLEVSSPDSSFESAYPVDVRLSDANLEGYLARYGSRPLAVSPHLDALYAYASFLAEHENGIFFNNTLWFGL